MIALSPAPPNSTSCGAALATPPLNAVYKLITEEATHREYADMKPLSLVSGVMYGSLAFIEVMCSNMYQRVPCCAVSAAPGAASTPLSNIFSRVPSMVVEVPGDSGYAEGVSATRDDNSSSESDIGDPNDQTPKGIIYTSVEATDDNQCLPPSQEESQSSQDSTEIVLPLTQPQCQPTGNSPVGLYVPPANKKKRRGTGKSVAKQPPASVAPVLPKVLLGLPLNVPLQPHHSAGTWAEETNENGGLDNTTSMHSSNSESNGTWAEETGDENGGPNVASAEPSQLISVSEGSWAEETHDEDCHNLTLPCESNQEQSESTLSEPGDPPEVPMYHNNVAMLALDPGTINGSGAGMPFILQMFDMDPHSSPQPEMENPPVQENEEGRKSQPSS